MATDKSFEVLEVGIFSPNERPIDILRPGEVGYIIANIRKLLMSKLETQSLLFALGLQLPFQDLKSLNLLFLQGFTPSTPQTLKISAMRS